MFFFFLATEIQNGNKNSVSFFLFLFWRVLSFQLPKFYIYFKFEIARLAKNVGGC